MMRAGLPPSFCASDKIHSHHRERSAMVYVRQSTMQQVEHHRESTRLQYALVERAVQFGWPREAVVVIDDDQGCSGASIEGRPGFQRLVAEVGLGHVGLVLGVEMSRLARSCRDWHQLLEICAMFDTLLGDADGVYNAGNFNDRLLHVRKEAVLSSQIEGTQSTLSDLLRFETEAQAGQPIDDVREVSNYVDAMMHGLERLEHLPLSLRLIREMHARLLQSGRGGTMSPGEFRRTQNWIGGTRPGNALFVPPPVGELDGCLDLFERFMHETGSRLPALIKAGLLHVQFETIHPFLDGNGRIGRLLVTLYLCVHDVLRKPLLYLSLYLKTHRADYYRLLQEVREQCAWEPWLEVFLDGVAETANQAFDAATQIVTLFKDDRERITAESERAGSALRVHDLLQQNPFATAGSLVNALSSPLRR